MKNEQEYEWHELCSVNQVQMLISC
jgi:hypothetical protein